MHVGVGAKGATAFDHQAPRATPCRLLQALFQAGLLGGDAPTLQAIVTSKMGSIEDNTSGGSYAYRASKVGREESS